MNYEKGIFMFEDNVDRSWQDSVFSIGNKS
jgi:hypothetical protein